MLEKVIKRSGLVEVADASKINRWMTDIADDLLGRLDWSTAVQDFFKKAEPEMTSQDLQLGLVKEFLTKETWPANLMAGRLYAIWHWKNLYDGNIPTVKTLQKKLISLGLMEEMGYTDAEYEEIEKMVNHKEDLKLAHPQVKQIIYKYGIQNRVEKKVYETPQFTYIRMAMALAKDETTNKMEDILNWYKFFSANLINTPTPNFNNLGTLNRGYASCCLFAAGDTIPSLAAADHIGYMMTAASAGLGRSTLTRSIGDPVRNGAIIHQGKMPYWRHEETAVISNTQGGRGGSETTFVSIYDPEVRKALMAQNTRTPIKDQIRNIHFAFLYNYFIVEKAAKGEKVFLFNCFTAPDLFEAFYSSDRKRFADIYAKYEADPNFKKIYEDAFDLLTAMEIQSHEVSTVYSMNVEEANRHTPFMDPIYSSNLCMEILQPVKPYTDVTKLYTTGHEDGEISTCNLGGIVVANEISDEDYEKVAYYSLKMIDKTIDLAEYPFPHLKETARKRRNASVGMVGVATWFARQGVRYDSIDGLKEAFKLGERHMYFLIKASVRLAKENGACEWYNRTRWSQGWLPIDTANKNAMGLADFKFKYDWEALREEVRQYGMRFSCLVAHMPTESSSKAAGCPNGVYPIRGTSMNKTDMDNTLDWVAMDDDLLGDRYQIAYDIDTDDLTKFYGVLMIFTDNGISADYYMNRVKFPILNKKKLFSHLLNRVRFGVPTKYYQNSLTTEVDALGSIQSVPAEEKVSSDVSTYVQSGSARSNCAGGVCSI